MTTLADIAVDLDPSTDVDGAVDGWKQAAHPVTFDPKGLR